MDVHSDHSEDESTAPGSSNGDSVYLTPSVSGMEIGSVRKSLLMFKHHPYHEILSPKVIRSI